MEAAIYFVTNLHSWELILFVLGVSDEPSALRRFYWFDLNRFASERSKFHALLGGVPETHSIPAVTCLESGLAPNGPQSYDRRKKLRARKIVSS